MFDILTREAMFEPLYLRQF